MKLLKMRMKEQMQMGQKKEEEDYRSMIVPMLFNLIKNNKYCLKL
jgi:hypothetical protein